MSKRILPRHDAYLLSSFEKDPSGEWHPSLAELIRRAKACDADGLGVRSNLEVIDAEFVAGCAAENLRLNVWTVNTPDIARTLSGLGVDSITTNEPESIRCGLENPPK